MEKGHSLASPLNASVRHYDPTACITRMLGYDSFAAFVLVATSSSLPLREHGTLGVPSLHDTFYINRS